MASTESIPTIQVGPHPHYKHNHGHHKHQHKKCKYYNQSGCRYKDTQCWFEHKPNTESVTYLILNTLNELSQKLQENTQKTDLEMQRIHTELKSIREGQACISQRLEAIDESIQTKHHDIERSHKPVINKLNKIKKDMAENNRIARATMRDYGRTTILHVIEGMNSIGSMVEKQMNRINHSPINTRSISDLRSKSTRHASEQQDIKQTNHVKELENKSRKSKEERARTIGNHEHQPVPKGSTQINIQQSATEQHMSRDTSHQEDKDVDDEKETKRREKKVIGNRNKGQDAKEALTQIKYPTTSESKTSVNKHASQQHTT
eukprot:313086_1